MKRCTVKNGHMEDRREVWNSNLDDSVLHSRPSKNIIKSQSLWIGPSHHKKGGGPEYMLL